MYFKAELGQSIWQRMSFVLIIQLSLMSSLASQVYSEGVSTLSFQSQESLDRLARSKHKIAFLALANHFKPQENRFFCGITTAVILLNALRSNPGSEVVRPLDLSKYDAKDPTVFPAFIPHLVGSPLVPVFERYTETSFFNSKTDLIKTKEEVYGFPPTQSNGKPGVAQPGVTLEDVHRMLLAHDIDSQLRHLGESLSKLEIVDEIKKALATEGKFILVNYFRLALGQGARRGHFSPLGAYDEDSDSFLVMDVTPNVHGWVWAKSIDLLRAMDLQSGENIRRGYLVVQEGNPKRKIKE